MKNVFYNILKSPLFILLFFAVVILILLKTGLSLRFRDYFNHKKDEEKSDKITVESATPEIDKEKYEKIDKSINRLNEIMKNLFKVIIWVILTSGSNIIADVEIRAPEWVPENKKVIFIELIKESNSLKKYSAEYSQILKEKPIITKCQIIGRKIVFYRKRGSLKSKVIATYRFFPKKCIIKNGGIVVEFKENVNLWSKLKEKAIEYGAILLAGIFVGGLAF